MSLCAVCLDKPSVTAVGPLPVCELDVDAALAKLGYTAPSLDIAGWLELVDPKELQDAAAQLCDSYDDGGVGKAYLSVLIAAAKEQV